MPSWLLEFEKRKRNFCSSAEQCPVHDGTTDLLMPGCYICSHCWAGVSFFFFTNSLVWTWHFVVLVRSGENFWEHQQSRSLTWCTCSKFFVSHRLPKAWVGQIRQMHHVRLMLDQVFKNVSSHPKSHDCSKDQGESQDWTEVQSLSESESRSQSQRESKSKSKSKSKSSSGEYLIWSHPVHRGAVEILTTRVFLFKNFFRSFLQSSPVATKNAIQKNSQVCVRCIHEGVRPKL